MYCDYSAGPTKSERSQRHAGKNFPWKAKVPPEEIDAEIRKLEELTTHHDPPEVFDVPDFRQKQQSHQPTLFDITDEGRQCDGAR